MHVFQEFKNGKSLAFKIFTLCHCVHCIIQIHIDRRYTLYSTISFPPLFQENDKIEALLYYKSASRFHELVANLTNLRLLYVRPLFFDQHVEGPMFLSNELRFLYWSHYPASPFPESFQPTNLLALKLPNSFQKELWQGSKVILLYVLD